MMKALLSAMVSIPALGALLGALVLVPVIWLFAPVVLGIEAAWLLAILAAIPVIVWLVVLVIMTRRRAGRDALAGAGRGVSPRARARLRVVRPPALG